MEKKYLNLKGITEILSEKELRKVIGASGGSGSGTPLCPHPYLYCAECMSGKKATICSITMDGVYELFGMICQAGGMLWEC